MPGGARQIKNYEGARFAESYADKKRIFFAKAGVSAKILQNAYSKGARPKEKSVLKVAHRSGEGKHVPYVAYAR